jgi:uncharacterized membrane protein (UPF0136 family)
MKKYIILKLIGLAILTMVTLVVISFIEVAVYSYLINPEQTESVYEAHAELSAPYVSGIFGFVVFFLVARYWRKKGYDNSLKLAILFPVIYIGFSAPRPVCAKTPVAPNASKAASITRLARRPGRFVQSRYGILIPGSPYRPAGG